MEWLWIRFPASGVETPIFIPPLVAFLISFFTSMGGVSGAFLLLPFQMSVLGYTGVSVSGTNLLFNTLAIPPGLLSYVRQGRMLWGLVLALLAGTIPGMFAGYVIRVRLMPGPEKFQPFVGLVLLYLGLRLLRDLLLARRAAAPRARIRAGPLGLLRQSFRYGNASYEVGHLSLFPVCFAVGVVGGAYGIGGGSLIAPFLVAVLGLPVYAVSAAVLANTFLSSLAGVLFYWLSPLGLKTSPDWLLGGLFALGGIGGIYTGGLCQKYFPERLIKAVLAAGVLFVAFRYLGLSRFVGIV